MFLYIAIPFIIYLLSLYYSLNRFTYYYNLGSTQFTIRGLLDAIIIGLTFLVLAIIIFNALKYLWYLIIAIFYWAMEVDNKDRSLMGYFDKVINERKWY